MNYLSDVAADVAARVGITGNPHPRRGQQGQRGEGDVDDYDVRSFNSGQTTANRDVNLLAGAHRDIQEGGTNNQGYNPRGGQAQQRGRGDIPAEINNDDTRDIMSNVTGMGGGGDQGMVQGGGPARQAEGGQGQPQPRQGPGGAINARIKAIANRHDDAVIGRELEWQNRVEGDQNKGIAFRDQAINQINFRAFAFMKGKSPVVHMAHSVGQFFGMAGLAAEVQGKYISFIGDRGNGRYPVPFILPPQNTWAWAKVKYLNDSAAFEGHFEDQGNWDKLWTTEASDYTLTEKTLPRLLALPTFIAEYIHSQGGSCLPHSLHTYIKYHLNGETQIEPERWRLVLDWCMAAAQEKNEMSLLNIGTLEPALCQDPEFLDWCERRINITLGDEERFAGGAQQTHGGEARDLRLVEQISNNMGRSFLAGVQALAPTIVGAARQGGHTKEEGDDVGGKYYSENNVAALKGYCGVLTPAGIPTIWDAFQQTKELASHRHNLRIGMQQWSKKIGLDIDKAPFFTENSIKDIIGLKFNPGEAVPTYSSAQRDIDPHV
jgi:hypothetical protein